MYIFDVNYNNPRVHLKRLSKNLYLSTIISNGFNSNSSNAFVDDKSFTSVFGSTIIPEKILVVKM